MKNYRTSVGLDVHARSVLGCGLDGETGEVFERRLIPDHREILAWVRSLPGPAAVTYEAGPTGFALARCLLAAGMVCLVAAPSKLQRPSGDRVKTDTRDARHLARLLHLGEIVEVTIPSIEQEAARDLVRAREDVRGDLMSARHRVSKLLLRQGIVYSGGRRGLASTNCGCALTDSTSQVGSWPTTRRSMPCWHAWTGGSASIPRSPPWLATRRSPRW